MLSQIGNRIVLSSISVLAFTNLMACTQKKPEAVTSSPAAGVFSGRQKRGSRWECSRRCKSQTSGRASGLRNSPQGPRAGCKGYLSLQNDDQRAGGLHQQRYRDGTDEPARRGGGQRRATDGTRGRPQYKARSFAR